MLRRKLNHYFYEFYRRVKDRFYNYGFIYRLWMNGVKHGSVFTMNAIPCIIVDKDACDVEFCGKNSFGNYQYTSYYCKCKIVVGPQATLKIGFHTGLNGAEICCFNKILIGDNVSIGGGTRIYDSNFHNLNYIERRDPKLNTIAKTDPVIIEDDAFIGTNCIIGKGVTIGARSIIAAGSVVVKSIPADCIAGGNPCKVIKQINN